jgi:hypothetical protein
VKRSKRSEENDENSRKMSTRLGSSLVRDGREKWREGGTSCIGKRKEEEEALLERERNEK